SRLITRLGISRPAQPQLEDVRYRGFAQYSGADVGPESIFSALRLPVSAGERNAILRGVV
ncbi:hypothetical protein, partial [Deinococcus reticulitermitis]|uniref:hypothetical protein n=1 Tax=Deinococcus reticulitermitis TaxID=856736 RepID=UPI001C4366A6